MAENRQGGIRDFNPTDQDAYWREHYQEQPYVKPGRTYQEYRPAYRYGWEARTQFRDTRWEDVQEELQRGWEASKGESPLTWEEARQACQDAWMHCAERPADRVGPDITGHAEVDY